MVQVMRVLLDTHAFIWAALGNDRLSERARKTVEAVATEVFVSAASAWEIAVKVRLGKLPGAEVLAADLPDWLTNLGFQGLPVTVEHGQRAGFLPGDHKDPFDRMLIAQAQAENLVIVSNEKIFDEWHVPRIW
jgi:PIN domain nuclease of toxin-antitoxin system